MIDVVWGARAALDGHVVVALGEVGGQLACAQHRPRANLIRPNILRERLISGPGERTILRRADVGGIVIDAVQRAALIAAIAEQKDAGGYVAVLRERPGSRSKCGAGRNRRSELRRAGSTSAIGRGVELLGLIHKSGFVLIVERSRISEAPHRSGRIGPRFALPERAAGKRNRFVRIFRRPQRNEVDRASKRIAPVGIFGSQAFGHVPRRKTPRPASARDPDPRYFPSLRSLPVERHERFRRIRSRVTRRPQWPLAAPPSGRVNVAPRQILQSFDYPIVAERIETASASRRPRESFPRSARAVHRPSRTRSAANFGESSGLERDLHVSRRATHPPKTASGRKAFSRQLQRDTRRAAPRS
jgi:hypothetical protein